MDNFELDIKIEPENQTKIKDLTGKKIGKSTITGYLKTKSNVNIWNYKCECGHESSAAISSLNKRKGRGCKKCFAKGDNSPFLPKEKIGLIIGDLKIISYSHTKGGHIKWLCECSCGEKEVIPWASIRKGRTTCRKCSNKKYKIGKNNPAYIENGIKIGDKFNNLTIIGEAIKDNSLYYECRCDCGETRLVKGKKIYKTLTCKTCADNKKKGKSSSVFKDLSGKKFNNLKVIELVGFNDGAIWKCLCDCGNVADVKSAYLVHGSIKSCGCRISKTTPMKEFIGKKYNSYTVIGIDSSKNKNGKIRSKFKCQCECGKIRLLSIYTLEVVGVKSCIDCFPSRYGKDNPNYNPSLSEEDRFEGKQRGRNPKNRAWRKSVFKRDNKTCVITGKTGDVCAHHLESWGSCPELRYEISNGITILHSLHAAFHSKYGLGDNTRDQFYEFVNSLTEKELESFPSHKKGLTVEQEAVIINCIILQNKFKNAK